MTLSDREKFLIYYNFVLTYDKYTFLEKAKMLKRCRHYLTTQLSDEDSNKLEIEITDFLKELDEFLASCVEREEKEEMSSR